MDARPPFFDFLGKDNMQWIWKKWD